MPRGQGTPRAPFPDKTPFPHPPHEEMNEGYYWKGPNASAPEQPTTKRKAKK